jgi:nitrate reductase delta subunit
VIGLRRRAPRTSDDRVVHLVAGRCLDYPTAELATALPAMREALAEHGDSPGATELAGLLDHLGGADLAGLQRTYVDTFDLSRKHALYLSYWTDGDTRRRGEVLGRFKTAYRSSGAVVDTHGELPDYLPMVLEFAARIDAETGRAILQDYRASLELLRIALEEKQSPYAGAVVAVCATLPGQSPPDRAAVMEMVGMTGPHPTEAVGLEPYDPRLLPLQPVPSAATSEAHS